MKSYFRSVPRCDTCHAQCHNVLEDVTRTPSKTVLIEANQFNRSIATDEHDVKVNVWATGAPPSSLTEPKYPIDTIVLEKIDALRNGKIVLSEELNIETIKSYGEEEDEEDAEDDDKDFHATNDDESIDDDDYTTSSTQP